VVGYRPEELVMFVHCVTVSSRVLARAAR
jgi:hypothetical protein